MALGLGEPLYPYFGQTFVAGGEKLQSLDLKIDPTGPGPTKFNLLITTVKDINSGQFQPGQVLKEIAVTVPLDADPTYLTVHVNLKGVDLVQGVTYAFILDAFAAYDGTGDIAGVDIDPSTTSDGYHFRLLASTGTRAGDFNADWDEQGGSDIVYTAAFSQTGNTIFGTGKGNLIDATHAPKNQPTATAFDDTIYGKNGRDSIYGGDGFDILDGGKHKDTLYGGDGGDKLNGGAGNKNGNHHDTLFGGAGEDCFLFDFKMTRKVAKQNSDKIGDYSKAGGDTIYLAQTKFTSLAVGDLDNSAGHITYKNNSLFYDDMKFVKFEGSIPASLADIHLVVYA